MAGGAPISSALKPLEPRHELNTPMGTSPVCEPVYGVRRRVARACRNQSRCVGLDRLGRLVRRAGPGLFPQVRRRREAHLVRELQRLDLRPLHRAARCQQPDLVRHAGAARQGPAAESRAGERQLRRERRAAGRTPDQELRATAPSHRGARAIQHLPLRALHRPRPQRTDSAGRYSRQLVCRRCRRRLHQRPSRCRGRLEPLDQ